MNEGIRDFVVPPRANDARPARDYLEMLDCNSVYYEVLKENILVSREDIKFISGRDGRIEP